MSNQVRAQEDGLARIRAAVGQSTFHGITVQGHCMGIVARTWRLPSQPAGYPTAFDGAQAVIRAGRMRPDRNPPVGAVPWWAHGGDGRPGHVATINRPGFCLGNVGSTIPEAALSRFNNLRWLGWCWPADVPNWGTVAPPTTTPTPQPPAPGPNIRNREDDVLITFTGGGGRTFWLLSGGRLTSVSAADAETWTGTRLTISNQTTWDRMTGGYPVNR